MDRNLNALLSMTLRTEEVQDTEVEQAFRRANIKPDKLAVALDLLETKRPQVHAALQVRR